MLDGILPIYKERGMTSHDVVFKLRKILKMKKIGHAGTLDPDVDGVLLVLLGNSTKVSDYAMNLGKSYRAEICLGISTITQDISGQILSEKVVEKVNISDIKYACSKLIGKIIQKPPIYSAVKVNGKKLYEYAREGKFDVQIPEREIEIYSINLLEYTCYYENEKFYFTIDVNCGKGTYIRTIATQLGDILNLPSCMSKLTRTSSGDIKISDCFSISYVEENRDNISKKLLSKEYALSSYQFVELPKFRAKQVINGLRFRKNQFPDIDFSSEVVFTYNNEAIAVYYLKELTDELLSVKTTFPKNIE
ncbi:tRNA pseudouridine(55) synthase TruB [Gemella sp. zg-1178]|uniref:tRNA pseudouridine(55) synthase TruB n=1 Tax=Gemella sp. zg-1178 TaxID=2840372 RepID=UPI001C04FF68|nr:tRNA pseudouridine(55) synthase TruB [Gemella sp. zg-1178]MBU0278116.1 tRNA pseudouridine(55) synthase TruB [Gemella sp. zg-1178]